MFGLMSGNYQIITIRLIFESIGTIKETDMGSKTPFRRPNKVIPNLYTQGKTWLPLNLAKTYHQYSQYTYHYI